MSTIKLGQLGEKYIESLCNKESITVNNSKNDDCEGWDFCIEFSFESQTHLPLDATSMAD